MVICSRRGEQRVLPLADEVFLFVPVRPSAGRLADALAPPLCRRHQLTPVRLLRRPKISTISASDRLKYVLRIVEEVLRRVPGRVAQTLHARLPRDEADDAHLAVSYSISVLMLAASSSIAGDHLVGREDFEHQRALFEEQGAEVAVLQQRARERGRKALAGAVPLGVKVLGEEVAPVAGGKVQRLRAVLAVERPVEVIRDPGATCCRAGWSART